MNETLYRKPWPGLVAFAIAILSQWLGHSTYAVFETVFGYPVSSLLALMIFVAGFIYVAQKNPVRPQIS